MKRLLTISLLTLSSLAGAQGFPTSAALAGTPPAPPTGAVYAYLTGTCTGTTCTGPVTVCLSSNSSSCPGTQVANTSIFYTLDGTPANEADIYYGPGGTAGEFTIPDPGAARKIVVNAVLVQTECTTSVCNGTSVTGCSVGSPCFAEIIQNGMNVKAWRKENVACNSVSAAPSPPGSCVTPAPADTLCASAVFAQTSTPIPGGTETGSATTPAVQHGGTTCASSCNPNQGVRGVTGSVWDYTSQAQPTVDLYTNSDTMVEHDLATASAVDCSGTSGEGDTEDLTPVQNGVSITPGGPTKGCDKCTVMAASYYVGHVYAGTPSGTSLNPANLSELETDHNWGNATFNSGDGYGYGTSNGRCSTYHASPVIVGGTKYGQWEYSSQNGTGSGWRAFTGGVSAPTHDCPPPFGTIGSQTSTSTTVPTFTPGTTNTLYNGGETSYGLEPGILLIDQETANAESEQCVGPVGGGCTSVVRGIGGTTPHAHASGALATLMVKVQLHATADLSTGATGCIGSASPTPGHAMYMDYFATNGVYQGIAAYQPLMGLNLSIPSIAITSTWGTQLVNGSQRSVVCSYFGSGTSTANGWHQLQPYMKAGTGNPSKIGIFDQHDNLTLSWGIVGQPSQTQITQNP